MDELWQEGQEEKCRLWIEYLREKTLPECTHGRDRLRGRHVDAAALFDEGLEAEIDQIDDAGIFDDFESQRGCGEQRRQSEGRHRRMEEIAGGDAGACRKPDALAAADGPGKREQCGRPGNDHQTDHHQYISRQYTSAYHRSL